MKMKCRRNLLFLPLLLIMLFGMTAAAGNSQKVTDHASILSEQEEAELQELFWEIAETYQCDVVVHTTDSCEGKSPQNYTDDYYYENGYGYGTSLDGIMLMVSMGDRKFHLATRGKAIDIFTDYGLEIIDENITGYLSAGEYYDAFAVFGKMAEEFMSAYEGTERADEYGLSSYEEADYEYGHLYESYEREMSMGTRFLIAAGAGLLTALIVLAVLFAQLKSVRARGQAQDYIRPGSFRVTRSRDVFLYRTVQKVRKQNNNGGGGGGSRTHRASGGRAGGRTGSF